MISKLTKLFFLVVLFLFSYSANAQVVINEIMSDPTQSEYYNEWIEIYNSGSEINLTDLMLCGQSIQAGYVKKLDGQIYQEGGLILSAGQYAVITDGPSTGTEGYDNFSVASSTLALHVTGSEMCSNGLSNNGEAITLSGPTSDSVVFSQSSTEL